jgi:hypothetical protein
MGADQCILAILTGAGFGFVVHLMGSTASRLAVMLVMLYVFQSLSQTIWRLLDGRTTLEEVIIVGELRLAFGVAAVLMVLLLNRRFR